MIDRPEGARGSVCRKLGLAPPSVVQNAYSLLERFPSEYDVFQVTKEEGLGFMAYSPLAAGLLTGRFRRGKEPPPDSNWARLREAFDMHMTEQTDRVISKLCEIAAQLGKSPAQVAIAWVLDHPDVTSAIIGPDRPEHVDEATGSIGWRLDPADREALDRVSAVTLPEHIF